MELDVKVLDATVKDTIDHFMNIAKIYGENNSQITDIIVKLTLSLIISILTNYGEASSQIIRNNFNCFIDDLKSLSEDLIIHMDKRKTH